MHYTLDSFAISDRCLGVAVYGYMKNPKARLFTHPNPKA